MYPFYEQTIPCTYMYTSYEPFMIPFTFQSYQILPYTTSLSINEQLFPQSSALIQSVSQPKLASTPRQNTLFPTKHTLKPLQTDDKQNKLYNDIMLVLEKCFPENKEQVDPLVKKIIDTLYPQISANKENIVNGIIFAVTAALAAVIPSKPVTDTIMRVVAPAVRSAIDKYF